MFSRINNRNMEKPDRENLNAWMIGKNLNVFQKGDAMVEYGQLLDYIKYLEQRKSEDVVLDGVSPRLFYVMNHTNNDGEEFMEQLSIGLEDYADAVKFRDSDYHKKKDPNCFILCSINEG